MELDAIAKLISDYGPGAIFIAAVIYFIYFVINKVATRKKAEQEAQSKLAEEKLAAEKERVMNEQYQQFVQNTLKQLGELREAVHPTHTQSEQEKDRANSKFILSKLEGFIRNGANRAYYFSMHNGGRDLLGNGLLKMSITAEKIDPDTEPIMCKFQNIPRTLFGHLYDAIDDNGAYNASDLEIVRKEDPMTYQFLNEHGAKQAFFRAVKREDGLIIGVIAVEYYKPCENPKEVEDQLMMTSQLITGWYLGHETAEHSI